MNPPNEYTLWNNDEEVEEEEDADDLLEYHNRFEKPVVIGEKKEKVSSDNKLDLTIQLYLGGLSVIGLLILFRLLNK